jgi:epoxyqueuosine reductase
MHYLVRQEGRRSNPSQLLDHARSVIMVAFNYYSGPDRSAIAPGTGVVARYARFDDYHTEMWNRLEALLRFVQVEMPGTNGKAYCDTGPVTERDLAMRAGLGWIGKHTNLISKSLGNWLFLGEIIVDIALPADEPMSQHCGTCARCIPACPTHAIVAPYVLDARRCISYLTIELKGSIPVELRPLIGNRVYGCDDCLAACPWNKFAVESTDPAVQPRDDLMPVDLVPLLALTDAEFSTRFRHSPIKRTKRSGIVRNACVALGNIGDLSSLAPLAACASQDSDPMVREHAEWAILRIKERQDVV